MNRKDLENMSWAFLSMASVMRSIETKPRLTKDDKSKLLDAYFELTEYRDEERYKVHVLEKVEAALELEKQHPQYDGTLAQIISDYAKSIEEELKKLMDDYCTRVKAKSQ